MSPQRRVCCCRKCWGVTDNFNRATLGSDWEVLSGTWGIDSDTYLECIAEGVLVTTQRQPAPKRTGNGYNFNIEVDLLDFPSGTGETRSWKVICGFVDINNFDWISFDYDVDTNILRPTFYRRTAGSDSTVMDPADYPGNIDWNTAYPGIPELTVYICYANMQWSAKDGPGVEALLWEVCGGGKDELPADTDHGLFGFLGETDSLFDNLVVKEHWESHKDCSYCDCTCIHPTDDDNFSCLPETVTLTLVRTSGSACAAIDNQSLTMYQSVINGDCDDNTATFDAVAEKSFWVSDLLEIPTNGEQVYETYFVRFRLSCNAGLWILEMTCTDGALLNGSSNPASISWADSTCDPLSLVFPGFTNGGVEIPCDFVGSGDGLTTPACGGCAADGSNFPEWSGVVTV